MPSELSPPSLRLSERDDDDDSLDGLHNDLHDFAQAEERSPRAPGGEHDADAERFSEWDDLEELNEHGVTKANTVRAPHVLRCHPRPRSRPRRSRRHAPEPTPCALRAAHLAVQGRPRHAQRRGRVEDDGDF